MKLFFCTIVAVAIAAVILAVGFGGCQARFEVFGENLSREIDRFLGEDEVRIKGIEVQLRDLHRIREYQRLAKYQAQVRAETYEKKAAAAADPESRETFQHLAAQSRTVEQRASTLLAASDAAIERVGTQLQTVKEKHRLLKEVRAQAEQAEHLAGVVDPQAVGELQDSIQELFTDIEAQLRTATERADLAIGSLPDSQEESRD